MDSQTNDWTVLVYRMPPQPTRLRLSIWRKLQALGAVYLQDGVCLLPSRPDLSENLTYVASAITEMGGTSFLFVASSPLPGGAEQIIESFRTAADTRLGDIQERLKNIEAALGQADSPADWERIEEDIKRERVAYLRARRLNYFGSSREQEVDALLDTLRTRLDDLYREGGK